MPETPHGGADRDDSIPWVETEKSQALLGL